MEKCFPCKYRIMIRALRKLGLFVNEKGRKHALAQCINNNRKTTIPRHKDVKPEIVKSIIDFLLEKGGKEDDVIKLLK